MRYFQKQRTDKKLKRWLLISMKTNLMLKSILHLGPTLFIKHYQTFSKSSFSKKGRYLVPLKYPKLKLRD